MENKEKQIMVLTGRAINVAEDIRHARRNPLHYALTIGLRKLDAKHYNNSYHKSASYDKYIAARQILVAAMMAVKPDDLEIAVGRYVFSLDNNGDLQHRVYNPDTKLVFA